MNIFFSHSFIADITHPIFHNLAQQFITLSDGTTIKIREKFGSNCINLDIKKLMHDRNSINDRSSDDLRRIFGLNFDMEKTKFKKTVTTFLELEESWNFLCVFLNHVSFDHIEEASHEPIRRRLTYQKIHLHKNLRLHPEYIFGSKETIT